MCIDIEIGRAVQYKMKASVILRVHLYCGLKNSGMTYYGSSHPYAEVIQSRFAIFLVELHDIDYRPLLIIYLYAYVGRQSVLG